MNLPKTLIIMGRSGSGKGTQINLIKNYYLAHNNEQDIFHFEPGNIFRKVVNSGQYTGTKIKESTGAGKLVPDFITNGLFTSDMVHHLNSEEQLLIFDGYPRSISQVKMLNSVLDYFGRDHAVVIHVEVSEKEVRNRLTARGRNDDVDMNALNTRINFYNNSVLPSIELLKENQRYDFININGEQNIEDIHKEIITALKK